MKNLAVTMALLAGVTPAAYASVGQRVWVDIDSGGKITTLEGPIGGAGSKPEYLFNPGRVFTRDLADPSDDNTPEPYATDFPAFEATQYPSRSFGGTFKFDVAGDVLFYKPTGFVPVASAFPNPTERPSFIIEQEDGEYSIQTGVAHDQPLLAFSTGSHGHPTYFLNRPDPFTYSEEPDAYVGVYAIPLKLELAPYATSETFYVLLGWNAGAFTNGTELYAADALARTTLVPEPTSISLLGSVMAILLRRRRLAV